MKNRKLSKLFVHVKQLTFMQRISDRSRDGYLYYIGGTCSAARVNSLYEKFRRLYDADLEKDARYRIRLQGSAVFRFLAYQQNSSPDGDITWLLMRTDGVMPIATDEREKWRRIDGSWSDRIQLWDRFELVRHTRKNSKKPAWSWRINKHLYRQIRANVITMIRRREDRKLAELLTDYRTCPGFALIREQLRQLYDLVRAEWKRSRHESESLPELPSRIGYARRVKDKKREIKFKVSRRSGHE